MPVPLSRDEKRGTGGQCGEMLGTPKSKPHVASDLQRHFSVSCQEKGFSVAPHFEDGRRSLA